MDRFCSAQLTLWALENDATTRTLQRRIEEGYFDLNGRDSLGRTPLGVAIMRGRADAAALLVDKGAHVDEATWQQAEQCFDPKMRSCIASVLARRTATTLMDVDIASTIEPLAGER